MTKQTNVANTCVVDDPSSDNVAVSKIDLVAGTEMALNGETILLDQTVSKSQRFAVRDIPEGAPVVQYGCAFAVSLGIKAGELISCENTKDIEVDLNDEIARHPPETEYSEKYLSKTFDGFRRPDGRVGTRNYYLVVPTSLCVSHTAARVAVEAADKFPPFPNVDEIVAIPNTEGCGCAHNMQVERFLRVLKNFINHPNVGGVLIIDLGCEQTNRDEVDSYLKSNDAIPSVPTDWLTIQEEGGTGKTIRKALEIIERRLPGLSSAARVPCAVKHLLVGTECGASDAFSGITANPVIGNMVDKIISGKGSAILSEVPEMIGAEHLLIRRMRNETVVQKFRRIMAWYINTANMLGVDMADNITPGNRAGGLINQCIKSLGAIAKGGTTAIEDVLDYGETLSQRGLNIMQGPGNDPESVTGIVAGGANIVCFSTGRGAITGNAIVPVIKVSSTTELYEQMRDDIDFDAGSLLEASNPPPLGELGDLLVELVISVASGKRTKSEENGQREFQVWTAGKLSL